MRLKVHNPSLVDDLVKLLKRQPAVTTQRVADDELEVGLVRADGDAALELLLVVRAWAVATGVVVEEH